MKFKFLFLIFNVIILIFLLIIVFMPLVILGGEISAGWSRTFWGSLWPLIAILITALVVLDAYYFSNRKLFRLLEREDWPALSGYLEMRVLRKGRYSANLVRLLANTYLVMSDSAAVVSLENKLALVRPALLDRHALIFGTARILGKDYAGAERFFAAHAVGTAGFAGSGSRARQGQWIAWYYGFSLLLDKQFEGAAEQFRRLAEEAQDPLVAGLAAWFLADNLSKITTDTLDIPLAARERIRTSLKTRRDWDAELAKTETEVHVAILRKYLNDTGNWIYGGR
ncbi:MAG: hypothetical protein LBT39_08840 [Treponema sp.]|nr:hypothetical protein [Treponema sp.]